MMRSAGLEASQRAVAKAQFRTPVFGPQKAVPVAANALFLVLQLVGDLGQALRFTDWWSCFAPCLHSRL